MASKLLTYATLLIFNSSSSSVEVLKDAHLLITNDTISRISTDLSSISAPANVETIDCSGKIISPGFVDTHRHVWQTVWRSLGADTFLTQYILKYSALGSAKEYFSAEDIYTSTLAGYIDAINTGVTTVVDHCHAAWAKEIVQPAFQGAIDGGVRAFWCYDPTDFHAAKGWTFDGQIEHFKSVAQLLPPDHPTAELGLAIDALATASTQQISSLKSLLSDPSLNITAITTHLLGGPWPTIGNNTPSAADAHGLLDLAQPLIISHAPFISKTDIALLRSKNQFLSITPESEMHYGHGQITSRTVSDHASLGVDTAWTYSGDMLTQARLWLQANRLDRYERTLNKDLIPNANPMAVADAFLLATRQGGLALRRDDIGVIREGAKADLVIFDTDAPHLVGSSDALAAVMLHANVGDIEGVLVGGQWRKKNFQIVGTYGGKTWVEIKTQFKEAAKRIQEKTVADGLPEIPGDLMGSKTGDVDVVSLKVEE